MRPVLFIFLFSFVACASAPPKKPRESGPSVARSSLAKIEIDIAAGARDSSIKKLQKIIDTYASTDVAVDASLLLGRLLYEKKDYAGALKTYLNVTNSEYASARDLEAQIGAASALTQLGRLDEALGMISPALNSGHASLPQQVELHNLKAQVASQLGDQVDALSSVFFLASNSADEKQKEKYRRRATDVITLELNASELELVVDRPEFGDLRGVAAHRLGRLAFEERDFYRAKRFLDRAGEFPLTPDDQSEREQMLSQLEARRKVDPSTIGAVLPLTGKYASVGHKSLRGLQLGLGIYGRNRSPIRLAVVDSAGNPDTAKRMAERLILEDHAVGLVGSLLSRAATGVAMVANDFGVPVISLAQKPNLTQVGEFVFRNSTTSQAQMRKLVDDAMTTWGAKSFAILFPNDAYGIDMANAFWDQVLAKGGRIAAAQPYKPGEADFRDALERMVGTYYVEDRLAEFNLLAKDWLGKQKSLSGRQPALPDNLLPPKIDFDAIFIPDDIRSLVQVSAMMQVVGIKNVKLLGTNLWNQAKLSERAKVPPGGLLFVDSVNLNDRQFTNSSFFKEFEAEFGEQPGLLEVQAYDTGILLRRLLENGVNSRIDLRDALTRMGEQKGAAGVFSMGADREIQRPLVTLTLEETGVSVLQ